MNKLLILAGLALAAPVVAADNAGAAPTRSQAVSYSDIDLNTTQGAAEFKHRVRVALDKVCGSASSADLVGQNAVNRCYRENRQVASRAATAAIARSAPLSEVTIADGR